MSIGNKVLRRLRQIGAVAAIAGFVCCGLQAQSTTDPQPGLDAPASQPAAPIGTSFSAATGDTPQQPETRVTPPVGTNYQIGADDILTINVWHEAEVSRNVPVRPDGKISLPLIGDVQAAGLTPVQLQVELQTRFAKFLTDPAVSVIVAEIRSQRFNVLGQVMRPGTYPLIPPISVIDAVATAGGLREFAKPNKIYVLRTLPNGQRQRIKFQYKNVLNGKRGSKDLLLQTRDTVVVP
jgi:polysaccharide export outer membrane protein